MVPLLLLKLVAGAALLSWVTTSSPAPEATPGVMAALDRVSNMDLPAEPDWGAAPDRGQPSPGVGAPISADAPGRVQGPDGIQVQIFGLVPGAAALQQRPAASGATGPAGYPDQRSVPGPLGGRVVAAPLISRPLPAEDRRLALTFNGLPPGEAMPTVLSALRLAGARGTFFLYGVEVEEHPAAVATLLAAGHEVGTRGYRPRTLDDLSPLEAAAELNRATRAFVQAGLNPPRFIRPPQGRYDAVLMQAAAALGLEPVLWSSIGLKDPAGITADTLVHQARRAAFPGAVLMLHGDRPDTIAALPAVLSRLRQDGYSLITLNELLAP